VQERLDTYGAEDGGGTAEKFTAFMQAERAKWAKVVKEAGVKGES
jgi:tripartite-type tricarboxylate transporter receptor subunit TctC